MVSKKIDKIIIYKAFYLFDICINPNSIFKAFLFVNINIIH